MANIFQRLISSFTNKPFGQSPLMVGMQPVYPEANMNTYIKAYSDNATVYTIVSLMARKFAFIPRYLYKIENDKQTKEEKIQQAKFRRKYQWTVKNYGNTSKKTIQELHTKAYQDDVVEGSPLSLLLSRPNDTMGQDSFYQLIYTLKKLTGNSFEWLNRGDNDNVTGSARMKLPILERVPLPTNLVTINVDRAYMFGMIVGYTYWGAGQPIFIPKEDILHWKDPNPNHDPLNFSHFYGVAPLQAGRKLITQDDAQVDSAVGMFQNGGARGVLYNETMDKLNPQQIAASDKAIETKINNRAMKSAVAMLPGKWGYLFLGQNAVDMDLINAQDKTFQRIANLLGANPQIWETNSTFNNVEQARKDLITSASLPDAASYRDEENRVLLQAFGYTQSQYCIDIDVTDLPELQDDMEKLTTRTMANWTLTPNERRKELGHDPLPDTNMDIVFVPNNIIPIEDAAVPTTSLDPNAGFGADTADGRDEISDNPGKQPGNGRSKRLLAIEVDEAWSAAGV